MQTTISNSLNSYGTTRKNCKRSDIVIENMFKSGGTSALLSAVSGLDDFELICFLVVK